MTRSHPPGAAPVSAPEAPLPGTPFDKRVCICTRCKRLVTAHLSVERGCGPTCYEHLRGLGAYARLEAQGQQRFAWADDAGARA